MTRMVGALRDFDFNNVKLGDIFVSTPTGTEYLYAMHPITKEESWIVISGQDAHKESKNMLTWVEEIERRKKHVDQIPHLEFIEE